MARKKLETLTEQMYYVLLSLWEGPRHGYGIMQDVAERTQGRVNVGAGTLYALLARFGAEDLIVLDSLDDTRKTYRLTDKGRQVLREEFRRLRRQVADGSALEKEAAP